MKRLQEIFLLILMIGLYGCASMNSSFDCPMKPGVRCESLDQVNAQVSRGEIGHGDLKMTSITAQPNKQFFSSQQQSFLGEPLRYGETVQRIWIAPYEDTSGNYHQESEVYTIAKSGHWIGNPKIALNDDGE